MNRALSMISLATKAGKTKSGEFMTEKEVKEGRAHLVIVADDASDNTNRCRVCKRNQKTSGYGRRIAGTVYRR